MKLFITLSFYVYNFSSGGKVCVAIKHFRDKYTHAVYAKVTNMYLQALAWVSDGCKYCHSKLFLKISVKSLCSVSTSMGDL